LNRERYFAHETAVIDDGCEIGDGVKMLGYSGMRLTPDPATLITGTTALTTTTGITATAPVTTNP